MAPPAAGHASPVPVLVLGRCSATCRRVDSWPGRAFLWPGYALGVRPFAVLFPAGGARAVSGPPSPLAVGRASPLDRFHRVTDPARFRPRARPSSGIQRGIHRLASGESWFRSRAGGPSPLLPRSAPGAWPHKAGSPLPEGTVVPLSASRFPCARGLGGLDVPRPRARPSPAIDPGRSPRLLGFQRRRQSVPGAARPCSCRRAVTGSQLPWALLLAGLSVAGSPRRSWADAHGSWSWLGVAPACPRPLESGAAPSASGNPGLAPRRTSASLRPWPGGNTTPRSPIRSWPFPGARNGSGHQCRPPPPDCRWPSASSWGRCLSLVPPASRAAAPGLPVGSSRTVRDESCFLSPSGR